MLSTLPAELILRIIQHIPSICDKFQLLQTCRRLHHLLSTHVVCWSNLDLSPYNNTLNNNQLLNFLRNCNIPLNTTTNGNSITTTIYRLDLSGCWNLSEDLVVALSKSLTHINELCLNGYQLNASPPAYHKQEIMNPIAFEQQRDHVYQVRPSHDLSSMAMDLSKKSSHQLKVPFVLLKGILENLPYLTSLSIQYQDLSITQLNSQRFSPFQGVRHLDISCCTISQPALQTLLRVVGPNLRTLKMLNIDLASLTWLCLSQFCTKLQCLHVSCNEPFALANVRHAVYCLPYLEDFRLTRIRSGLINPIVLRLNPLLLKRLDLSPKMSIYPKYNTLQPGLSRERKHPPQAKKLSISNYATIEHCLHFSDVSLDHLSRCHQLVELRLCFPDITSTALHNALQQLPQLEIFELRQRLNKQDNYLTGLQFCKRLKELDLYSVNVTPDTIRNIMFSKNYALQSTLQHMTLSNIGYRITVDDINALLSSLRVLQTLCLGHLYEPLCDSFGKVKDRSNVSFYKQFPNQWQVQ
jgi:hypothetical protein